MTIDKNSNQFHGGHVPSDGVISIAELQKRWQIRDSASLIEKIEASGIIVADLNKKRLVRCADLEKLFWNE